MNFWEANRKLFICVGVALLAAIIVHFVVAAPRRGKAIEIEGENSKLRDRAEKLTAFKKVVLAEQINEALDDVGPENAQQEEEAVTRVREGVKKLGGRRRLDQLGYLKDGRITPDEIAPLRKLVEEFLPPTAAKAIEKMKAERAELKAIIEGLNGVLLEIPKNSRFRIRGEAKADPRFYFQKQLAELQKERCAGRPYPAKTPLGFTPEMVDKQKPALLLERLAAVDRLTRAVESAGLLRVQSILHGPVKVPPAKGVTDTHVALVPMYVKVTADERGMTAFVEEISRKGRFLALDSLSVEVTDPKARTFTMVAGVSALLRREGAAPGRRGRGPTRGTRPLPIGRY